MTTKKSKIKNNVINTHSAFYLAEAILNDYAIQMSKITKEKPDKIKGRIIDEANRFYVEDEQSSSV